MALVPRAATALVRSVRSACGGWIIRSTYVIVLLVCLAVLCVSVIGLVGDLTPDSTETANGSTGAGDEPAPPACDLLSVWQAGAAMAELPPDVVRDVAERVAEVEQSILAEQPDFAGLADPRAAAASMAAYARSIRSAMTEARRREGATYWLAFLLGQAAERPRVTAAQLDEARRSVGDLTERIVTQAEQGLRKRLTAALWSEHGPRITAGLEAVRLETDRWLGRLQQDALYPALKRPITQEIADRAVKRILSDGSYPNGNRATSPLRSAGEEWEEQIDTFFESMPGLILYNASYFQVRGDIQPMKYWGAMDVTAISTGTNSRWPIYVTAVPLAKPTPPLPQ